STRMTSTPERIIKCHSCHHSLSSRRNLGFLGSHVLGCGHIICDGCRDTNGVLGGKVWCSTCKKLTECRTKSAESSSIVRKILQEKKFRCDRHTNQLGEAQCPCGEVVCKLCAKSFHADHFNYGELFANADEIESEMARIRWLKRLLADEDRETKKMKEEINANVTAANKEIVSKFTLIIAQAISRCLDLLGQVAAVGRIQHEKLDVRSVVVRNKLDNMQKSIALADQCKFARNPINRLKLQKQALDICRTIQGMEELPKETQLKISFSSDVLSAIASNGDVITANLFTDEGTDLQVNTLPTALISTNLNEDRCVMAFHRFHKVLQRTVPVLNSEYSHPGFALIAYAAAPVVVLPPPSDTIYMAIANSTDSSDSAPRYELACKRIRHGTEAAAAASVAADVATVGSKHHKAPLIIPKASQASHGYRPFNTILPTLRGWKRVHMDETNPQRGSTEFPTSKIGIDDGTSENVDHDYDNCVKSDQPGPSSPKRIKVEEEEEEIDGSKHMENLMGFVAVCDQAMKLEDAEGAKMDKEVKLEVDEGGGSMVVKNDNY
ncbi:hypothetical protein PFISCL1PPCAC_21525, partial [Pristionchus fissidentatus]